MSEVSGSSISKGVFVCKGKKLKANPRDYVISKKQTDLDSDCQQRMESFEILWNRTSNKIASIQSELNGKVAENLLDFIQKSYDDVQRHRRSGQRKLVSEIPTAALVTGVNTPDHGAMFTSLTSSLKERVTPHVAVLRSVRCQTIHSIISDTVCQLLNTSDTLDDDECGDDGSGNFGSPPAKKKRTSFTMSAVGRWYSSLYKNQRANSGQSKVVSGCESQLGELSLKTPQKFLTVNLTRVDSPARMDLSPSSESCQQLTQMSLRSPRKYQHNNVIKNEMKSPRKRTASEVLRTACKSQSPPPKDLPSRGRTNTPKKSTRSTDDTPKKSDSPQKSGLETPRKSLRILEKTPQKSRNSPERENLSKPSDAVCITPKKSAVDTLKSPLKMRDSPKKGRVEELLRSPLTSPKKSLQKLWTSPRKANSSQLAVESPRPETKPQTPKSSMKGRKHLEFDNKPVHRENPVVIVIEDFEGFPNQVLQDFITICGHHLDELPLVLVFGIATTQNAVHRALPHAVSSMLSMEKFQAPPSSEHLTRLLTEILMTNQFPFKLSAKVFGFLLDIFLYHDFSVIGFTQALKYAMLEHFYSNPSSILCHSAEEVASHASSLSTKQLDGVRSCMSFRRFVESRPPLEQIKLLDDTAYAKKAVAKFMESLNVYHSSFFPVMRCLHAAVHKLPQWPLGKQVRELYALCLGGNVFDLPEYEHAINLVRSMSREELVASLQQMVCHLVISQIPKELVAVREQISEFCRKFSRIEDLALPCGPGEFEEQPVSGVLPKKLDMYTLKQKLQEMDKKKKVPTTYEALRTEAVDYLDTVFRKYLPSYKSLVLHEIVYFDDLDRLRRSINTSPRAMIQNALTRPFCYLANEALDLDPDQLTSDLPDISIAYKLHLECGRLINLFDWLQAFVTIVQSDGDESESQKKKKSVDRVLQARFIRAVSELQFLGFVKPTRRKTDHVARLTWGGC